MPPECRTQTPAGAGNGHERVPSGAGVLGVPERLRSQDICSVSFQRMWDPGKALLVPQQGNRDLPPQSAENTRTSNQLKRPAGTG